MLYHQNSGHSINDSLLTSCLAKQGLSVLHLDEHEYYGDRHASLTVDEMMQWVEAIQSSSTRYSQASYEFPSTPFQDQVSKVARQYALSVFPTILPARGDLIDLLIEEDVGKYVNFRLVDGVAIYQPVQEGEQRSTGTWKKVPAGKDQIFKDSSLSLLEKRRLMKFIMFASSERGFIQEEGEVDPLLRGESYASRVLRQLLDDSSRDTGKESQPIIEYLKSTFQLSDVLAATIAYGIAFCDGPSGKFPRRRNLRHIAILSLHLPDPAGSTLIRMNRYFRSIGRYGPSPFLVAQYGGIGEITQAFCRQVRREETRHGSKTHL